MTRFLYAIPVPSNAQTRDTQQQQRRVDSQGAVGGTPASVQSVAPQSGSVTLQGRAAGTHARLTATEFEELFGAGNINEVPFFIADEDQPVRREGYYALEDVTSKPEQPGESRYQTFDGRLTFKGSRGSHLRAVRTNVTTESNPFGSDATAEFGVASAATQVEWVDLVGGTLDRESATVQTTRDAEHGAINIYDATEPTFSLPVLVYDLPYEREYRTDVRVWDDYDREKIDVIDGGGDTVGSATVGSATVGGDETVVQWQRVYATTHEFVGDPIVETNVLRLRFDTEAGQLRAYRWNERDGIYETVQLGVSPWRLDRVSISHIALSRVDGQATFADSSGSATHRLNFSAKRGARDVLWLNPDNEGSVPSGLVDRLDPIARTSDEDPATDMDVVLKTEVAL